MNSRHLVLAGDSIFDNDGYVYGAAGVIEQLRTTLPAHCRATKIAVDGDCIRHVDEQLNNLPADATDLIVSVGGNDARKNASLLSHVTKPDDLKGFLAQPLQDFRVEYAQMLERIEKTKLQLLPQRRNGLTSPYCPYRMSVRRRMTSRRFHRLNRRHRVGKK